MCVCNIVLHKQRFIKQLDHLIWPNAVLINGSSLIVHHKDIRFIFICVCVCCAAVTQNYGEKTETKQLNCAISSN